MVVEVYRMARNDFDYVLPRYLIANVKYKNYKVCHVKITPNGSVYDAVGS